jgi:class 3 adenylate cyclase/HD superfamily phosphodiesterase
MEEKQNIEVLQNKIRDLEKKIKFLEEEKKTIELKYQEILIDKDDDYDSELKSQKYKFISILYSDVKGLTQLAQQNDAETLIDELDRYYFHFDTVIDKFNIKKLKSIGDTYLCAGGFPERNKINPIQIVIVALEMQQYLKRIQNEAEQKNQKIWDITFGIHTGPVLVNKQGKRKDVFELSGDTINIASRIESSCQLGTISISAKTYENVKDFFVCEYKGKLPVKYKGELALYTLKGYRPELSIDNKGIHPNEKFWTKLQMLSYDDLNEQIIDYLEENLPSDLKYHDIKHTIDVSIGVEIIGATEGLSEEELLILKTAALFHDSGLIYSLKNHEERSVEIANLFLPHNGYNKKQIELISQLILSTKNPFESQTILEKILCDADYEYIGRYDLIEILRNKYYDINREFHDLQYKDFLLEQKYIIENYDFYTQSAKDLKTIDKNFQIELINEELKKLT